MGYSMQTNALLCISCKACEVHCKVKNAVPKALKLGVHLQLGPTLQGEKVSLQNLYMPCLQCKEAPCLSACPTTAMRKRQDGIVFIEKTQCTGCKACLVACPWNVPQFDSDEGVMRKCDLCRDRLDAGKLPACVTGCTMGALSLDRADD